MNHKSLSLVALAAVPVLLLSGCQTSQDEKYERAMALLERPINCATAEADIRMLEAEKAHVEDQIAAGFTSITPAGLVVGLTSGTEGQRLQMTTGEYNDLIDERIAEIKSHCGLD